MIMGGGVRLEANAEDTAGKMVIPKTWIGMERSLLFAVFNLAVLPFSYMRIRFSRGRLGIMYKKNAL